MHNLITGQPSLLRKAGLGILAVPLILSVGCGSDDESSSTSDSSTTETTAAETTTTIPSGTGITELPSEEFCSAQADLSSAEDGAQRNTAIATMQDKLETDVPAKLSAEISDALDTLLTGDLTPEEYTAAGQTLADACN